MTSKGFGVAAVENLDAQFYDFIKKADVMAQLTDKDAAEKIQPAENISANTKNFIVDAEFVFNSSFIVRNYYVPEEKISAVSLKSLENFVLPGTSLKGILRHREEYIFGRLKLDAKFLNNLMGSAEGDKIKSRFIVGESYIENKNIAEISHTRNKLTDLRAAFCRGRFLQLSRFIRKILTHQLCTYILKF